MHSGPHVAHVFGTPDHIVTCIYTSQIRITHTNVPTFRLGFCVWSMM